MISRLGETRWGQDPTKLQTWGLPWKGGWRRPWGAMNPSQLLHCGTWAQRGHALKRINVSKMIPESELNKSTSTLGFNVQLIPSWERKRERVLPKHITPWNPPSKWATEIDRKRDNRKHSLSRTPVTTCLLFPSFTCFLLFLYSWRSLISRCWGPLSPCP